MKYKFYYDESYHDPAITQKSGVQNISNKDASLYFTVCIIGIEENKHDSLIEEYLKLEKKYKKKIHLADNSEFKGSRIKFKYLKNGLAGCRRNFVDFYDELFKLLDDYNVIIHLSTINKFELLVQNLFEENFQIDPDTNIIWENFVYSFAKFFNTHKTNKLVELIHSNSNNLDDLLCELNKILDNVINTMDGYELKTCEVFTANQIKSILKRYKLKFKVQNKYDWNYFYSLSGFKALLAELNIKSDDIILKIDGEGKLIEKIRDAARGLLTDATINMVDSADTTGVRIADFVSNFMGKLIKSIDKRHELNWIIIKRNGDFNKPNLLNNSWFDLNEDEFNCYQSIGKFFNDRTSLYWTSFTSLYNDEVLAAYSIFNHIYSFNTFDDYKKVRIEKHAIKINNMVLKRLDEQFTKIYMKYQILGI